MIATRLRGTLMQLARAEIWLSTRSEPRRMDAVPGRCGNPPHLMEKRHQISEVSEESVHG